MSEAPLERDLERAQAAARSARMRIARFVRTTPLLELDPDADGVTRSLKLETLQRTGSFKVRGAASALCAGPSPGAVLAASTGNHGLAVAAVASALGVPCRVFVPASAAPAKLARLRAVPGVEVVTVEGDPLLAELAARTAAEGEAATLLVPPYNDERVVLGQATVGLELLEQVTRPPDALFVAVGGGGLVVRDRARGALAAGPTAASSAAFRRPRRRWRRRLPRGASWRHRSSPTLSDATAGGIEEGAITVAICAALVDEFALVSEAEIADAMARALLGHALAIEGAAAVALAASLRAGPDPGARHVVVLGGGNVGAETLRRIL